MADERTLVEKIISGEAELGNYNLDADFDHDELRMLLDAGVLAARDLPDWTASDMIIGGSLSYDEYPWENFTHYEQIRQLEQGAITREEFKAQAGLGDYDGDDWLRLLDVLPELAEEAPWEMIRAQAQAASWFDFLFKHPEKITEKVFRNCLRRDQFLLMVDFRPDFRKLFLEIHGSFDCREEFELIMDHQLSAENATHKSEFTGHDIQEFIIEGVLSVAEFQKMNYAQRLTGHNWSEILGNTDAAGAWQSFCDFSRFNNSDWVNLLIDNPAYADRCPLEKLTRPEIDALLREQPDLAGKCGIVDAVGLYLINDAPYPTDAEPVPFFPPLPDDAPDRTLTAWLQKSFPEMTNSSVLSYVHRICFQPKTRLGTYSRAAAETQAAKISPGLETLQHFRLAIEK